MLGEAAAAVLAAEKEVGRGGSVSGDDDLDLAAMLTSVRDAPRTAQPAAVPNAPIARRPVMAIAIPRTAVARVQDTRARPGRGHSPAIRGTVVSPSHDHAAPSDAAPEGEAPREPGAPKTLEIPPEMAAMRSPKEDLLGAESFYGTVESVEDAILVVEVCRRGLLPRVKRRLGDRERAQIRAGSVFVFIEREALIRRWTDGKIWSPSRISGEFLVYRQLEQRVGGQRPEDDAKASSSLVKADGLVKKTISLNIGDEYFHLVCYYCDGDRAAHDELRRLAPSRHPFFAPLRAAGGLAVPRNLVVHSASSGAITLGAKRPPPPGARIVTVSHEALAADAARMQASYSPAGVRPPGVRRGPPPIGPPMLASSSSLASLSSSLASSGSSGTLSAGGAQGSAPGYVGGYANVSLYAPNGTHQPALYPYQGAYAGPRAYYASAGTLPSAAHPNGAHLSGVGHHGAKQAYAVRLPVPPGLGPRADSAPSIPSMAPVAEEAHTPRAVGGIASISAITDSGDGRERDAASLLMLSHFASAVEAREATTQ